MADFKTQMLAYAILPRFLPRLRTLLTGGFSTIACLLAVIFQAVRLLPPDHSYLDPKNYGRFGIRHVMAQAANNLVLDRHHIDQIFIFFTILTGLILLVLQIVLVIFAAIAQQPALALGITDIFQVSSQYNPGTAQDITFIILDRVFGVQGIFNSCISTDAPCLDLNDNVLPKPSPYPQPFHLALHGLLRFYSMGIFFIGVMIILYFTTAMVAETAATGTPFGKRANHTWVPVRLIVFFAMLLPLNIGGQNAGFNAAQIITFWVAKTGSNFATNAWGRFNQDLGDNKLIEAERLVATPNIPDVGPLVRFMFLAKTCKIAEEFSYPYPSPGIQAYLVRSGSVLGTGGGASNHLRLDGASYEAALDFSDYGNMTVVFGVYQEDKYMTYMGSVKPFCGQINIPVIALDARIAGAVHRSGASAIQELYFQMVQQLWHDTAMTPYAECLVRRNLVGDVNDPNCGSLPDADFIHERKNFYQQNLKDNIPPAIQQQIDNGNWDVSSQIMDKGWAGASIWYNRIAETNGAVTSAIANLPSLTIYPYVMEQIAYQRTQNNENLLSTEMFNPALAGGKPVEFLRLRDADIAGTLHQAYTIWNAADLDSSHITRKRSNIIVDTINLLFGTSAIFDMRKNTDIHPLAQLSALGKGMMDAAVRNIALGTAGEVIGTFGDSFLGQMAKIGGKFLYNMGLLTIVLAFVLYYILPFLPFIYFLFAISGWVKSIFEAMIAMPLWALAHIIRIDGQGLPGPAASNGYFLLLEIMIRPILILMGFLASILIFSAMIEVLNDIFTLVVANVGGFDLEAEAVAQSGGMYESLQDYMRNPIDLFMFTVVYVVLVYMSGTTCFKLIDLIPQQILRYIGSSIETLVEADTEEVAENVIQKTWKGGTLATGKLQGGALAALLA